MLKHQNNTLFFNKSATYSHFPTSMTDIQFHQMWNSFSQSFFVGLGLYSRLMQRPKINVNKNIAAVYAPISLIEGMESGGGSRLCDINNTVTDGRCITSRAKTILPIASPFMVWPTRFCHGSFNSVHQYMYHISVGIERVLIKRVSDFLFATVLQYDIGFGFEVSNLTVITPQDAPSGRGYRN